MNELRIFHNASFGSVRVMKNEQGETLFCLADVCKILALSASRVKDRLSDGVTFMHPIVDNLGRTQMANFVSEAGLYDTILYSHKEEAKQFREWVTKDVLPQIRKTGGYIPVSVNDDEKTIMAKALQIMQKTLSQRDMLIEAQKRQIENDAPKVQFAKSVENSDTLILVRDLAKILKQYGYDTGEIRLFETLRKDGYLTQNNHPTQRSMELGVMRVVENVITTPHGAMTKICSKITGKGQTYFVNRYCNKDFNQRTINFNESTNQH